MKKSLNTRKGRYQACSPSFLDGVLFFLGATNNPYNKEIKRIYSGSVSASLYEDWYIIGGDFKKVVDANKHLLLEEK